MELREIRDNEIELLQDFLYEAKGGEASVFKEFSIFH